jgi:molecular chaperone GrpE
MTEEQGGEAVNSAPGDEQGREDGDRGSAREPQAEVDKVEALTAQLAEVRDRYLRLMADFENFKRRALKEQSELLRYQGERLIVDLLEVVDNLELAVSHSSGDGGQLRTGVEMILKMFVERLAKWDVRGESAVGLAFDPQRHAAISRVPGGDAAPGTIVGELKKAYFYKDKLIRPAEVVVAVEPAAAES